MSDADSPDNRFRIDASWRDRRPRERDCWPRKMRPISTRMWTTCGSPGGLRRSSCRGLKCVLLCALVSGCAHIVKISYPPESELHPTFDKPYTVWNGERVQVDRTTSLRPESFKYVAAYDRVFLADSIRQRGLRDEFKIEGKGTPLVVFAKNPKTTPGREALSVQRDCARYNCSQRRTPGKIAAPQTV
jgi:hypothetical protein